MASLHEKVKMNFGGAIASLKGGKSVTRLGWNNSNIKLDLQVPDENSKMTLPYIYMCKYENKFPCDLSCESILAEDWVEIELGDSLIPKDQAPA